jgi:hypothetical protein
LTPSSESWFSAEVQSAWSQIRDRNSKEGVEARTWHDIVCLLISHFFISLKLVLLSKDKNDVKEHLAVFILLYPKPDLKSLV